MTALSFLRRLVAAAALAGAGLGAPVVAAPALTAVDAQAWLDGLMPTALHTAQVPGAVVVIVKDGQPLVQQGYGYADRDKRIPVDVQRTLFRPGSVSKLFTWTAVMQLVEQGKLDLDADLNQYLDFKVPPRDGKAMTLRHVMTHTTGLEEAGRDLITYTDRAPDLAKVLKDYVPPYLFEPGTVPGYSNYATALAGYIVQRVSGTSFDNYVEQHVFAPLGMKNATFRQPLPPALAAQMSQGYASLEVPPKGFEIVNVAPAGSLSASGGDMGRFMAAYLLQGRLGDAQILKPETVQRMYGELTRPLPDLLGIGLGFYQRDLNGHRAVGHGGDTTLFHSDLILFVDDGIGLFVSVNSAGKENQGKWLRDRLLESFADRYLPDARPRTAPAVDEATARQHAHQLAGAYRNTRREDSTWLSVLQLLSPVNVQALEDGRVAIELAGSRSVFREVKPYLWEEEHGKRRLQAAVENGKVKHWGLEPYVFAFIFQPVPFMASPSVLLVLLSAVAVAVVTALLWPVVAVLRRRHGVPAPPTSAAAVRLASCLVPVAVGLWVWTFSGMDDDADLSLRLLLAQAFTALAFIGGLLAALWHARGAWAAGTRRPTRGLAVLWLLAFGVLAGVASYHHLIGFNPNY